MPLTKERKEFIAALMSAPPRKRRHSNLKPRLVLDTNVWLDVFHWNDAEIRFLRPMIEAGEVVVFRSEETIKELAEVLDRGQFGKTFEEASRILEAYVDMTEEPSEDELSATDEELHVKCRDPLDQKFLVLAVAAQAHYLVTKDKLVLKAGKKLRRLGVEVVTPGLLEMLLRK